MNVSVGLLNTIIGESNSIVIRPLSDTSSMIRMGGFAFTYRLAEGLEAGLIVTVKSKLDVYPSAVAMTET